MSLKDRKGYIATISAIIISAIVMAIALVISAGSFLGRFDSNGLELKDVSREAALGCLEIAKLKLKTSPYGGGETISIGENSCDILAIESSGGTKILRARSTVGSRNTNLEMVVASSTLETISLVEKPSF